MRSIAIALPIILILAILRSRGPAPTPADGPSNSFSAHRAMSVLRSTIGGERPHPTGSAENAAVRERIAAHLRGLGYEVEVQSTFACNAAASCAPVHNLIARRPGAPRANAVLMATHYDSVPAGPGASDDGVGVAAMLEIARIVRNEQLRNPVVFLIDDGEEAGLLGAEAYVADPRLRREAAVVVNVEARGTSGPSYLFETSGANGWMIGKANAMRRPVTTSLFASIYDRLPNDTDLTVFKRSQLPGVNFAFIRHVVHYHTPNDDLKHVDLRSMQHHGDNALAMLRAFGAADLAAPPQGNAIWFDVLGFFVISWPAAWTMALAAIPLIFVFIAAFRFRRTMSMRGIALGIASFLGSIILTFGLAIGLVWLIGLRAKGQSFVAFPEPAIAAAWLIGFTVTVAVAALCRRRATVEELLLGHAIGWSVLAIVVANLLPGGSYLFIVPALFILLRRALVVPAAVAAIVFFPLGLQLYDALGTTVLPVVAVMIALVTTTFSPLHERSGLKVRAAIVVATIILALAWPPLTEKHPSKLSLTYLDDGEKAQWLAPRLTPGLRDAFSRTQQPLFPWLLRPSRYYTASAPRLPLAPVEVQLVSDQRANGERRLTFDVRSARGADRVGVAMRSDAAVASMRINGVAPPPRPARWTPFLADGWQRAGVRAGSARIELVLRGDAPVEVTALDYSFGLPREGAALAQARTASLAVPSDEGDLTMTMRKAKL